MDRDDLPGPANRQFGVAAVGDIDRPTASWLITRDRDITAEADERAATDLLRDRSGAQIGRQCFRRCTKIDADAGGYPRPEPRVVHLELTPTRSGARREPQWRAIGRDEGERAVVPEFDQCGSDGR